MVIDKKKLRKALLERALSVELDEHLGYYKLRRSEVDNSRNGVSYTINMLDSQLRKVTNNKRGFPNDEEVFKSLFAGVNIL